MKYYLVSDTHSFYTPLCEALEQAGYFEDHGPHRLVILGDLLDRGGEPLELLDFIGERLDSGELILIRGNHEDLMLDLIGPDEGEPLYHHMVNGTFRTAVALCGWRFRAALADPAGFCEAVEQTDFVQRFIPRMLDYYETKNYIFTHGYVPARPRRDGGFSLRRRWRQAKAADWRAARWINGMDAARTAPVKGKTVVCGHVRCSWGHAVIEGKGEQIGENADYSPYEAPGVLSIDACTVRSGRVNVVVVEDEEL